MRCGPTTTTPARTCSRFTSDTSGESSYPPMGLSQSRRCARSGTDWCPHLVRGLALPTMRARLAAAISIVAIAALGGSFFALHERTGSDLQARIDSNLKEQFGEFQQESSK